MNLIDRIKHQFNDSIQSKISTAESSGDKIVQAGQLMVQCLLSNNKILCCGNGTSAAIAQLFAANMLNRYQTERPSLPAFALTTNSAAITSIANDDCYQNLFSKQIKALGQGGDILLAISSHLQNRNLIEGIETAHQRNMQVILLSGEMNGAMSANLHEYDIDINVPTSSSARVEETHLLIIHCLCDIIDRQLFETLD